MTTRLSLSFIAVQHLQPSLPKLCATVHLLLLTHDLDNPLGLIAGTATTTLSAQVVRTCLLIFRS